MPSTKRWHGLGGRWGARMLMFWVSVRRILRRSYSCLSKAHEHMRTLKPREMRVERRANLHVVALASFWVILHHESFVFAAELEALANYVVDGTQEKEKFARPIEAEYWAGQRDDVKKGARRFFNFKKMLERKGCGE
eukprot:scaffold14190_cov102-Isochrysis_galbana.AAC.3